MTLVAIMTVPWPDLLLPSSSQGPLLYWVLVVSILGYSILTSATSVLVASHVAAYISVQPLAGTVFGWIAFREQLHEWDSGALFIVLGLFLVTGDDGAAAASVVESSHIMDRVV
jgi:drug/metabolite transporter (DMT)-like permease